MGRISIGKAGNVLPGFLPGPFVIYPRKERFVDGMIPAGIVRPKMARMVCAFLFFDASRSGIKIPPGES